MQLGDVWLISLPASGAREQTGERPAIVLQDTGYGQASPLVLVVPLTSQTAAARFPAALRVAPSPENGLTSESIAMVFQLRALDRGRFVRKLGQVGQACLAALFAELDKLTGRDLAG